MKKHVFLLGSFMASYLVAANTLLVIACQKKASVNKSEEDEKDTETVVSQAAIKLNAEIKNAIDDIIASPTTETGENWYIELNASGEINKQIKLDKVEALEESFIKKENAKFASLKDMVLSKIKKLQEQLSISNLEFKIKPQSIKPNLTNLNGIKFMQAINKLTPHGSYATTYAIDPETKIELFKVVSNISYKFSFNNKSVNDTYNDVELLLAGDIKNNKEINRETYKIITEMITTDKTKWIGYNYKNNNKKDYIIY